MTKQSNEALAELASTYIQKETQLIIDEACPEVVNTHEGLASILEAIHHKTYDGIQVFLDNSYEISRENKAEIQRLLLSRRERLRFNGAKKTLRVLETTIDKLTQEEAYSIAIAINFLQLSEAKTKSTQENSDKKTHLFEIDAQSFDEIFKMRILDSHDYLSNMVRTNIHFFLKIYALFNSPTVISSQHTHDEIDLKNEKVDFILSKIDHKSPWIERLNRLLKKILTQDRTVDVNAVFLSLLDLAYQLEPVKSQRRVGLTKVFQTAQKWREQKEKEHLVLENFVNKPPEFFAAAHDILTIKYNFVLQETNNVKSLVRTVYTNPSESFTHRLQVLERIKTKWYNRHNKESVSKSRFDISLRYHKMLPNKTTSFSQRNFIEWAIEYFYKNFKKLLAEAKKDLFSEQASPEGQMEAFTYNNKEAKKPIAIVLTKAANKKLNTMKKKTGLPRVELLEAAIHYGIQQKVLFKKSATTKEVT